MFLELLCHWIVSIVYLKRFGIGFGELRACTEAKPCKSRPSESISPKRELQSYVSSLEDL